MTTASAVQVTASEPRWQSVLAVLAAIGLYLSAPEAMLPARLVGVAAVALPLALTGRLRLTRRVAPWVVLAGVGEVGGFAAFAVGARHGIAISAVLSSQFATLAALAGIIVFRERLARVQIVGVAAVTIGVAMLSSLQV